MRIPETDRGDDALEGVEVSPVGDGVDGDVDGPSDGADPPPCAGSCPGPVRIL